MTKLRVAHIGGPTTLIEFDGWRLLTDPTPTTWTTRGGRCCPRRARSSPRFPARRGWAARGLAPWETTRLERPGRPTIDVTATPCRHGPPGSRALVGDVIGFTLRWDAPEHGVLWITGDTVLYGGVRQVAERLRVDTALLHLGGVRFPLTGPLRYSMTARDAVELCRQLHPRTAIPVHYEGWSHFQEDRATVERELDAPPADVSTSFRWVELGDSVTITM